MYQPQAMAPAAWSRVGSHHRVAIEDDAMSAS